MDETVVVVALELVEELEEVDEDDVVPLATVVEALVRAASPTVPTTDAATNAAVAVRALRLPTSRMFTIAPRLDTLFDSFTMDGQPERLLDASWVFPGNHETCGELLATG